MYKLAVVLLALLAVSSGCNAENTFDCPDGYDCAKIPCADQPNDSNVHSCSVTQEADGVHIRCPDGTSAFIEASPNGILLLNGEVSETDNNQDLANE